MINKRFLAFGVATVLSLSTLLIVAVAPVWAVPQNCQWTGTAADHKFSTAGNWSGCGAAAPLTGDNLVFNTTVTDLAPNNDMAGASFATITFQGAGNSGFSITGNTFTLTGGITDTSVPATTGISTDSISAPITVSGPQTVNVIANGQLILGSLSGSGNLTKTGAGDLELSADNTAFTGAFTISAGHLGANDPNSLGTSAAPGATISDGADVSIFVCATTPNFNGNLTLNGASSNPTSAVPTAKLQASAATCGIGAAPGSVTETYGIRTNASPINLKGTITLGADTTISSPSVFSLIGTIVGAHALNLLPGSSPVVINSATNGATTANGTQTAPPLSLTLSDIKPANTVDIEGNTVVSIDGQRSDVTVGNGATLKGHGTVGMLIVNTGGAVAPGNSPGCLTSNNLTLNGTLDEEIGGTDPCTGYDQIKVTGTVNLTGATLSPSLYGGFVPTKGQTYTIIDNDGSSDAVIGTFANLAEGATLDVNGTSMSISYQGGDGNDVVLTVLKVGTPNTGFSFKYNNPALVMLVTTFAAGALLFASRRHSRLNSKS